MISFDYELIEYSSTKSPFVQFTLADPIGKKNIFLTGLVDTGYDGELLLSYASYSELELRSFELPASDLLVGGIVSGKRISMQNSSAILQIEGLDMSMLVEIDTFIGCTEILIGRKFLRRFVATLHGQSETISLKPL